MEICPIYLECKQTFPTFLANQEVISSMPFLYQEIGIYDSSSPDPDTQNKDKEALFNYTFFSLHLLANWYSMRIS